MCIENLFRNFYKDIMFIIRILFVVINRGKGSPSGCSICGQADSWWLVRWNLMLWHEDLTKEIDFLVGHSSNWRRCFGSLMRLWSGLEVEVGWRFGSTKFSLEIRVLYGAARVWCMSIKGKAMEWTDIGKVFWFALTDWIEVGVKFLWGCGCRVLMGCWPVWWSGRSSCLFV